MSGNNMHQGTIRVICLYTWEGNDGGGGMGGGEQNEVQG